MGISSINGQLITSLTGIERSRTQSVRISNSSGGDAAVNRTKLRSSSDTFAGAVSRLGSVASYLQISKDTLTKLGELVDDTIKLVDKASKRTTSDSQRSAIDREFKAISRKFSEIADEVDLEDADLLSTEGLENVLALAGLTKSQSKDLAKVFNQFVVSNESDSLASPELKGKSAILPAAVQPPTPNEAYTRTKISANTGGTAPTAVFATDTNVVFGDDQDPVNQNDGVNDTGVLVDDLGNTQSLKFIDSDATILSVSEESGYVLFKSQQDFVGENASGVTQLFLANREGTVLYQYTSFSSNYTIESGDLSSDGLTVAFISNSNITGSNADNTDELYVARLTDLDIGSQAAAIVTQESSFNSPANISSAVKISENGKYVAFDATGVWTDDGLNVRGYLTYNTGTDAFDMTKRSTQRRVLGFTEEADVISNVVGNKDVYRTSFGIAANNLVFQAGGTSTQLAVSENGYLGYVDATNNIRIVDVSNGLTTSNTLVHNGRLGDSFSTLSIGSDPDGNVKVAAAGIIPTQNSLTQVYLFKENTANVKDVISAPDTVNQVFDYSLKNRSNAFRAKEDLVAIKKQISKNIKAVEEGIETVKSNLNLAAALSGAFNTVASNTSMLNDAEKIAKGVRSSLLKYGLSSKSLNQTENLESISSSVLLATA